MAQVRVRIFPEDMAELVVGKGQMKEVKYVSVEVYDAGDNETIPLITLEEGDYLEVVFE